MRRFLTVLLSAALCLSAFGCVGGTTTNDDNKNKTEIIPQGYIKTAVDSATGVKTDTIGVEFDPHFFSQNVTRGNVKAEDWDIVVNRVKELNVQKFRIMILPEWLEPLNDDLNNNNINWDALTVDSVEMKSLYKVLDLAEQNNIEVNLTLWGAGNNVSLIDGDVNAQVGGKHFLAKDNSANNWVVGTKYPKEFAENFSMFIQLLVTQKQYTCIKEITPINEPDWSYQIDNLTDNGRPGIFNNYAELCRELDARFRQDGIRDKVLFNLSDNTDNAQYWLDKTVEELDDIADKYNSHTYIFGYETKNSTIAAWQAENYRLVKYTGKPHVIGEFGSNRVSGSTRQSDIDYFERGVLLVRQMVNFFNNGAAGTSYWTLLDQYYRRGAGYGEMMQLGLWKSAKEDYREDPIYYNTIKENYEIRPIYYAYGLMSRLIEKNSDIYPLEINNDFVAGTAFKAPDGKWAYVIANGSQAVYKAAISNYDNFGDFDLYAYTQDSLPTGDIGIQASNELSFENKVLAVEVNQNSVVVLKQK